MSVVPRVPLPPGVTTDSTRVQADVISHYAPNLLARRNAFFQQVSKTDVLDPLSKELVRLRVALISDCDL